MLSPTLREGLGRYAIGEKLRALRLRKKMGLVELGRHSGLSAALLSKIERGKMFPTLPTLLRIAMVFSVGLDYFFTDDRKRRVLAVVRRAERLRLPDTPGLRDPSYHFESLDFRAVERKMNSYWAVVHPAPQGKARTHAHAGAEMVYVLSGTLGIRFGEEEHILHPGDAIYFDSGRAHAYRRIGPRRCTALVVTVP